MNSLTTVNLIDTISETKTSRPKAAAEKEIVKNKESDKDKIRRVLVDLESVRANLEDSKGQGYLFTASAILFNYLELS
jgi:hypothetical protein